MQFDNIRNDPWIPTIRFTTLMLMLACVGIGIGIGWLTTEKIVVIQDPLTTAAEPHARVTSSSSAKEGVEASRELENRDNRSSGAQEEPFDTAAPPAALPSSANEAGGARLEPENRPSRSTNAREEHDMATPPAALVNPGTANEYQVRHKSEPRPARMNRGRKLDRDESGERVEGRDSARDYRDLRNQMLNQ